MKTANINHSNMDQAFLEMEKALRQYLIRRLPDQASVDDLVQDIFIKALTTLDEGRRIENLMAWVLTVAKTMLADFYRARARELESDLSSLPEEDESAIHQVFAECMLPFIESLTPKYRDALMAELRGTTYANLAREEGVSISAIKSRAARGRLQLKEKLIACCHIEIDHGMVSEFKKK